MTLTRKTQIITECAITGITFAIPFAPLPERPQSFRIKASLGLRHPIFSLPQDTLLNLATEILAEELSVDAPEAYSPDRLLILPALWNCTGLISYISKLPLPQPAAFCPALSRTIIITKWLQGRSISWDVPRFLVEHSTKDNLYFGFLKELEDFRESLAEKRKRTDLNAQMQELTLRTDRREMFGKTALTPGIIARVCQLINWNLPEMAAIAERFLLKDSIDVINDLHSGASNLKDLSDLLIDIELLDWQSTLRDRVLEQLRTLVNVIHTFRPLSNAEKELFTETITATKDLISAGSSRDLIPMTGEKVSFGRATVLMESGPPKARPDLFPVISSGASVSGTIPPWKRFISTDAATTIAATQIEKKLSIKEIIAARAAKIGQTQIAQIATPPATVSNKYEILTEPTTNPNPNSEGIQND